MVERCVRNAEVGSSNLLASTFEATRRATCGFFVVGAEAAELLLAALTMA